MAIIDPTNLSLAYTSAFQVNPLTDNSKPFNNNHRLAKLRWKSGKNTKAFYPTNLCVSVPVYTVMPRDEDMILSSLFQQAFNDAQDALIKALVEKEITATSKHPSIIAGADILPHAVAAYKAEETTGTGQLSTVKVETWFDTDLAEILRVTIADNANIDLEMANPEEVKKLEDSCLRYRTVLTSLASPKTSLSQATAEQLNKVLALADDSTVRTQLQTKVDIYRKPAEVLLAAI